MDDAGVSAALKAAAEEVLETMFFTTAEEEPVDADGDGSLVAVRVRFQGTPSGTLALEIGHAAASTIAADFLGVDAEELSQAQMCQVICELANMVCGATLSRIGSETQFELASPEMIAPGGCDIDSGVRKSMYLPNGPLTLRMILGQSA